MDGITESLCGVTLSGEHASLRDEGTALGTACCALTEGLEKLCLENDRATIVGRCEPVARRVREFRDRLLRSQGGQADRVFNFNSVTFAYPFIWLSRAHSSAAEQLQLQVGQAAAADVRVACAAAINAAADSIGIINELVQQAAAKEVTQKTAKNFREGCSEELSFILQCSAEGEYCAEQSPPPARATHTSPTRTHARTQLCTHATRCVPELSRVIDEAFRL